MSKLSPSSAIIPPKWEKVHVAGIQALERGDATPHQQKLVLDWILDEAARAYDLSFRPESERETCFAEGRRFVGLQIVKLLKLNTSQMRD